MERLTVAEIARALGQSFDSWARKHGFSEDVASKAIERYMKGCNIVGYRQQIVLRELYKEFGLSLVPTQDLPSPVVLVALVREKLEKVGGNNNGN